MLKTIRNTNFVVRPKNAETKIGINSVVNDNKIINQKNLTKKKIKQKRLNFKNHDFSFNPMNINIKLSFFISKTRLAFIKLM